MDTQQIGTDMTASRESERQAGVGNLLDSLLSLSYSSTSTVVETIE
jgi:hypothetical protein